MSNERVIDGLVKGVAFLHAMLEAGPYKLQSILVTLSSSDNLFTAFISCLLFPPTI